MDMPFFPATDQIPLHEHLRRHAETRGDQTAVYWYGSQLSWHELNRASDAFAARLQKLGVNKGDPVVLFMNNCPQYMVAHYGVHKAGGVVCPSGPLNKEHELAYQLSDLKARIIVAAVDLLPVVNKVRPDSTLEHVFVVHYSDGLPADATGLPAEFGNLDAERLTPADCLDFQQATQGPVRPTPVALGLDDVGLITYTSGTTGLPKGAMLTHGSALFKSVVTAQASGIESSGVTLVTFPLYHIAGKLLGVCAPVYKGAAQVLLHRFEPEAALLAIARHKVTHWHSVAPMNIACMQADPDKKHDLRSLRYNPVTSFGVSHTEDLARQWEAFVGGTCSSPEAGYGLSETHTMDTAMPYQAIRWGTHGKPMPGVHVRIVDPDTGIERPLGEEGEITLMSPGNFKGYLNKPEATAATLRDGWVHTGDMGKMDAEGYMTFMGRFKEMIKVSGYSVFPEEVETILIKHPAVAQAAVIAEPDPEKGEVVKAFIVTKPGTDLDADTLISWSRNNMANYKVPKHVRFIDALPATGSGKVLRRLLKDMA